MNGPSGSASRHAARTASCSSGAAPRAPFPDGPTLCVNGSQKSSKPLWSARAVELAVLDVLQARQRRSAPRCRPAGSRPLAARRSTSGRTSRIAFQKVRSIVMPPSSMSHMQAATVPPGRVTRAISRTPLSGIAHERDHKAGQRRVERRVVPRQRFRHAFAHVGSGTRAHGTPPRTAGLDRPRRRSPLPTRAASSTVSPPGPQPTSRTRAPARASAASHSAAASDVV